MSTAERVQLMRDWRCRWQALKQGRSQYWLEALFL